MSHIDLASLQLLPDAPPSASALGTRRNRSHVPDSIGDVGAGSDLPVVLFVRDLARLLDRTESAVRKALAEGRLGPFGEVSGRKFVLRDVFLKHLESLQIDPARPPSRGATRPR